MNMPCHDFIFEEMKFQGFNDIEVFNGARCNYY
jgi:hypothetical protein